MQPGALESMTPDHYPYKPQEAPRVIAIAATKPVKSLAWIWTAGLLTTLYVSAYAAWAVWGH